MSILGILMLGLLVLILLDSGAFVLIPFILLSLCVFFLFLMCLTYPWLTPVVLLVLFLEFGADHRRPKPQTKPRVTTKTPMLPSTWRFVFVLFPLAILGFCLVFVLFCLLWRAFEPP